jgi:hypothetical protein
MSEQFTNGAGQSGPIYVYWAACTSCGYTTAAHGRVACPDCCETMVPHAIAGAVIDDEPRSIDADNEHP